MIKILGRIFFLFCITISIKLDGQTQHSPTDISFVRQGGRRFILNKDQSIPLAALNPNEIIGISAMYHTEHRFKDHSKIKIIDNTLSVQSEVAMDRVNYPGLKSPNWTYGALCLYHGYNQQGY
jgi:hypothetical protein